MPQDTMKDLKETLVPVTMITDINKSATEKFITRQTDYVTDLFNTGLAQVQALCSVREPKEVFELQIRFFKELDAKLADITEKEFSMLSETKEQLMDVIEKNMSGMAEVTRLVQNAQEKAKETINVPPLKQNGGSNKAATVSTNA